MKIPRKIDDRLKDAIVNVQFVPGIPAAAVWGYFHQLFQHDLAALPVFVPFQRLNLALGGMQIESQMPPPFLTQDQRFRIDLSGEAISFNLLSGYPGWEEYRQTLERFLSPLFANKLIGQVQRVGVRYISRFENVRIFDKINGIVQLNVVPSDARGQVRLEFERSSFTSVITLVSGFPPAPGMEASYFSLIDIDIIKIYPADNSLTYENIFDDLETAHNLQKDSFFSILSEPFIEELNPEY
ncbi:MAG: TIGR04255 family protein [Cytophagaceae bacterium]|nr:TIGR04255 family protein [Cytophagaceae bacterium]